MRKILSLFFVCTFLVSCQTTYYIPPEPIPDYVLYEGKKLALVKDWGLHTPLLIYFYQNEIKYPFNKNGRDHIATWEIKNNSLFLKNIKVGENEYKPDSYKIQSRSTDTFENGEVIADWFTGVLGCYSENERYGPYNFYFRIENGEVTDTKNLSEKEVNKIGKLSKKDSTNQHLMKLEEMFRDVQGANLYFSVLNFNFDYIVFNNKYGNFKNQVGYSPLIGYFSGNHLKWPYKSGGDKSFTSPYCKWKIENDSFFLAKIYDDFSCYFGFRHDPENKPLQNLFPELTQNDKIFANGISGIYIIENRDDEIIDGILPPYKKDNNIIIYLRIKDGIIQEKYTVPVNVIKKEIPLNIEPGLKQILDEIKEL